MLYLLKKLIDALGGWFNDEEMMLERAYQEVQSELIAVRREYVTCVGEEQEIAELITRARKQGKDTTAMESRLATAREATQRMSARLEQLEAAVGIAYTKKQVLIARDKANQARMNERLPGERAPSDRTPSEIPPGFLLFAKVFVVLWTLLFAVVIVKTQF